MAMGFPNKTNTSISVTLVFRFGVTAYHSLEGGLDCDRSP
jgi:hypothetical protein